MKIIERSPDWTKSIIIEPVYKIGDKDIALTLLVQKQYTFKGEPYKDNRWAVFYFDVVTNNWEKLFSCPEHLIEKKIKKLFNQ